MHFVAHMIRILVVAMLVALWVATLGAISVEVRMSTGHGVDLPGWWC
jgi:hypothetical protein